MTKYLVVFEETPTSVGAYVPDLPGCVAVASTKEEAEQLIREAIVFHIEGLKEQNEPVPPASTCTHSTAPGSYTVPKVREAMRLVEADGWYVVATRGSHRQYKHPTKSGRVTIAGRPAKDLSLATWMSILKPAGLRPERAS